MPPSTSEGEGKEEEVMGGRREGERKGRDVAPSNENFCLRPWI